MERIGLIAGGGELPLIFACEARKKNARVIAFALKGAASADLEEACDRVHWLDARQIAKFFLLLVTERIRKIAMLGKIDKSLIYAPGGNKEGDLRKLKEAGDKSDYGLLGRITSELSKKGVDVMDPTPYLSSLLPPKGLLTSGKLSRNEEEDVYFGFAAAKEIARFDIGQTLIVKDRAVISVEAMEGTDETIKRAAGICGPGFIVVKVSRPAQDMRWDVPVVGPDTVRIIAENRGRVLAVEAKRMFLVEKDVTVKFAEANNISVIVV